MEKNYCLYIYLGTYWYHWIKSRTIQHWLSICYNSRSGSNMEIHSADAGINSHSDSDNSRSYELYV